MIISASRFVYFDELSVALFNASQGVERIAVRDILNGELVIHNPAVLMVTWLAER